MTEGKKTAAEWVGKWLETSGAALELRTAQAFLKSTYSVEHSHHYPTEDGTREVDVVANYARSAQSGHAVSFRIVVAAECKSLDEPWVLYPADRRVLAKDETLFDLYRNRPTKPSDKQIVPGGYHSAPLFRAQDHYYAISDTGTKRETTYAALNQAWSATVGLWRNTHIDVMQASMTIFVPVVVTTAPLYSVRLLEGGEPDVQSIDRGLIVTRMGNKHGRRVAWVLNESALGDFTDDVQTSLDAMHFRLESNRPTR